MEDSRFHIDESSPEVKSFIYQQIQDFESFMTPKSIINVVSRRIFGTEERDKKVVFDSLLTPEPELFKVVISITENSTKLEEEAISPNIFEAITSAKTKLYNTLLKIQDEIITPEDREAQLISAKNSIVH